MKERTAVFFKLKKKIVGEPKSLSPSKCVWQKVVVHFIRKGDCTMICGLTSLENMNEREAWKKWIGAKL